MPRPNNPEPSVQLHIWLPRSLAERMDLLLLDPVRNRVRYGARSKLMARLVERWLAERSATPTAKKEN